jgi:hypothetical protein
VYIDNLKIIHDGVIAQNNAAGSLNCAATNNNYRLYIKGPVYNLSGSGTNFRLWLSSDAWTGTAISTANHRKLSFIKSNPSGGWDGITGTSLVDTGAPTLSDIDTLRFRTVIEPNLYSRDPILTYKLDAFQVDEALANPYVAASGAVLSHPIDVIRHFLLDSGAGGVDEAALIVLDDKLGASFEWGFDLRGFGFAFDEILQRMAFESRSNIIPVETASGRVWRVLAANADYGWGQAVAVIAEYVSMQDLGRGLDDLASLFSFRYDFDASVGRGDSEEPFRKALIASPTVSEVPILVDEIAAAADRFGDVQAEPIDYIGIHVAASAEQIAGYFVQERMAARRVFEIQGVPWFDGFPIELGDLVRSVPPWHKIGTEFQQYSLDGQSSTWIGTGCTLSDENTVKNEGTGSMKILNDGVATESNAIKIISPTLNLFGRAVAFDLFIPTGDLALISSIHFNVGSTGGSPTLYEFIVPSTHLVENAWQRLEFEIAARNADVIEGSYNILKTLAFKIEFVIPVPDGTTYILVDDVRVVHPSVTGRVIRATKGFSDHLWDFTVVEVPVYGSHT